MGGMKFWDRRLAALAVSQARPRRSKPRCRRISPGSCSKSAASSIRRRRPRSSRRCRRRSRTRASRPSATSNTARPIAICSMSSRRRRIASARPVLIFVHGGGFVARQQAHPGSPFYDNIMLWAVKNGFVGVNATYRLAPHRPIRRAPKTSPPSCNGSASKIAERGGDPARIYLMGHSAGAVHVASYVSHPEFHKVKDGGLAGAIMVSGLYDLTASPLGDAEIAYFGSDPSRYAERSSLQGLLASKIAADDRGRRTRPAALRRAVQNLRAGGPARAATAAPGATCCRSTAICRRSMRSTPRIRG